MKTDEKQIRTQLQRLGLTPKDLSGLTQDELFILSVLDKTVSYGPCIPVNGSGPAIDARSVKLSVFLNMIEDFRSRKA